VLTFLGTVLVASGSSSIVLGGDLRGLAFGLLAGAATAVYVLAGKRALVTYDAKTAVFYSFLFGALALSTLRILQLGPAFNLGRSVMLIVLVIAVVPTLLGYGTFTYSLRFIEAGRASIASSIEPAVAIYIAYLFLGEAPNLTQLVGSALIIVSVVLLQLKFLRT